MPWGGLAAGLPPAEAGQLPRARDARGVSTWRKHRGSAPQQQLLLPWRSSGSSSSQRLNRSSSCGSRILPGSFLNGSKNLRRAQGAQRGESRRSCSGGKMQQGVLCCKGGTRQEAEAPALPELLFYSKLPQTHPPQLPSWSRRILFLPACQSRLTRTGVLLSNRRHTRTCRVQRRLSATCLQELQPPLSQSRWRLVTSSIALMPCAFCCYAHVTVTTSMCLWPWALYSPAAFICEVPVSARRPPLG